MDIEKIRKVLFLNSQYCNYYFENGDTVFAGIFRKSGYKYAGELAEEKLQEINTAYRNYMTKLNWIVGIGIILYIYLVIFPFFTSFMKLPYLAAVMAMAVFPAAGLFLALIYVNSSFEKYLVKELGTYTKTNFKPDLKNLNQNAYQKYLKTPVKSVFILILVTIIFLLYALLPLNIASLVQRNKYDKALFRSNIYLAFVPFSSDVYARRAYVKFKRKKYKEAVKDFEKANKYSLSDVYNTDILGLKTYYAPKEEVISGFDKLIASQTDEKLKQFYMNEKALYLSKIKDYKGALDIYNVLIPIYEKTPDDVNFSPAKAYFLRGMAKKSLGQNGNYDFGKAHEMCPSCKYRLNTRLIRKP